MMSSSGRNFWHHFLIESTHLKEGLCKIHVFRVQKSLDTLGQNDDIVMSSDGQITGTTSITNKSTHRSGVSWWSRFGASPGGASVRGVPCMRPS